MKPLSSPLQQYWQTVVERLPEPLAEESLSAQAKSVLTFSDFLQDSIIAHPEWLTELESQPPQADEWQHYAAWLQEALSNVSDEAGLMRELRLFRRRIMVRIAWAQTLALVTEESILQQLSHLAETLIVAARDWLYDACCREWGTPCNAQGEAQPLLILGMGKLGGGELNFSSDIDLIFAWPEHGCTQGGRRELDNAQFFTRMGQRLIKVQDQPTQDGFVYRVDMRLRPFGESGPLVLSFAALEDYYQEQGRDWERYAMVKARIMGDSDGVYANELRAMLRPFVFRRYIDFSVIQSSRILLCLLRLPSGTMLIPMLAGAVLQSGQLITIELPEWLLAMAYMAIGWRIGLGFDKQILLRALRPLPQILLSIFALLAICAGMAWGLTRFMHIDFMTAYLATSPGGLDTVAVIAAGSNADMALIMAMQTLRLFSILLTGPAIARFISTYAPKRSA